VVYGLTYETESWFAGISATTMMDFYALDGATFIPTDGYMDNSGATPKFSRRLPRTNYPTARFSICRQVQSEVRSDQDPCYSSVLNVFDTEFLVSANRFRVLPGITRSFRLNVGVGI